MKLEKVNIIKSDERGIIYDCGCANFISRKKGTISGDHTHPDSETIFLVKGKIELTIGNETQIVKAPVRIDVDSNALHKLLALTDIELVYNRSR